MRPLTLQPHSELGIPSKMLHIHLKFECLYQDERELLIVPDFSVKQVRRINNSLIKDFRRQTFKSQLVKDNRENQVQRSLPVCITIQLRKRKKKKNPELLALTLNDHLSDLRGTFLFISST